MRIVCQQTILMKFYALFVIFEKAANLKLSPAVNYRWRFMGYISRNLTIGYEWPIMAFITNRTIVRTLHYLRSSD